MTHVLVVDDSAMQAAQAAFLLEDAGFTTETAESGEEALAAVARRMPDLIVTDLQMPGMSGLELVQTLRDRRPSLPVVLMTANGSEEIAMQALDAGAQSYVPKKLLAAKLVDTVSDIVVRAQATRDQTRLDAYLTRTEHRFELENDTRLIPALVSHLSETISRRGFCDENGLLRLTMAWSESLTNAIHHGNLEVSSDLRQTDERVYHAEIARRRLLEPYRSRRVHLTATVSAEEAVYVIRDEGPGFDVSKLPDPDDPCNIERVGGRGLLLIRTFMDRVSHNATGNEITLVKRRGAGAKR